MSSISVNDAISQLAAVKTDATPGVPQMDAAVTYFTKIVEALSTSPRDVTSHERWLTAQLAIPSLLSSFSADVASAPSLSAYYACTATGMMCLTASAIYTPSDRRSSLFSEFLSVILKDLGRVLDEAGATTWVVSGYGTQLALLLGTWLTHDNDVSRAQLIEVLKPCIRILCLLPVDGLEHSGVVDVTSLLLSMLLPHPLRLDFRDVSDACFSLLPARASEDGVVLPVWAHRGANSATEDKLAWDEDLIGSMLPAFAHLLASRNVMCLTACGRLAVCLADAGSPAALSQLLTESVSRLEEYSGVGVLSAAVVEEAIARMKALRSALLSALTTRLHHASPVAWAPDAVVLQVVAALSSLTDTAKTWASKERSKSAKALYAQVFAACTKTVATCVHVCALCTTPETTAIGMFRCLTPTQLSTPLVLSHFVASNVCGLQTASLIVAPSVAKILAGIKQLARYSKTLQEEMLLAVGRLVYPKDREQPAVLSDVQFGDVLAAVLSVTNSELDAAFTAGVVNLQDVPQAGKDTDSDETSVGVLCLVLLSLPPSALSTPRAPTAVVRVCGYIVDAWAFHASTLIPKPVGGGGGGAREDEDEDEETDEAGHETTIATAVLCMHVLQVVLENTTWDPVVADGAVQSALRTMQSVGAGFSRVEDKSEGSDDMLFDDELPFLQTTASTLASINTRLRAK